MGERRRVALLILIMAGVAAATAVLSIAVLYRTAFEQTEARLVEAVQSQARMLEAVARFDAQHSRDFPEGSAAATLSQIRDAHLNFERFGGTREFTLGRRQGEEMVFLLRHRHGDRDLPSPGPLDSELAEPMRLALSGLSGVLLGLDYRGEVVLAAHEPVEELDMGMVAKIDLAEIRSPFIRAAVVAASLGALLVVMGAVFFVKTTRPLLVQLEDREARYRALFQNMGSGSALHEIVLDRTGQPIDYVFLEVNDAFEELTSLRREDLVGRRVTEALPGIEADPADWIGTYGRVALTGEACSFESYSEALQTWYSAIAYRPQRGQFAVVITDITERKRVEEELKEYSEGLEQMVAERTRELEGAQEQLVRQEKLAALGQLAGGLGHELRNPLGVISNAAYYLKMTLADSDEKTGEYLGIISSEIGTATKIVSDLLDFSRIRSMEKSPTDVSQVIAEVLETLTIPDEVEVVPEAPVGLPAAQVDPRHLRQVLENLLTNACQAMPEGGRLAIGVAAASAQVVVRVRDTGPGIPREHLDKVFEPLFTTKARGIGLGLAVSRSLSEANGGSIEVESQAGKGTTFTVFLPTREGRET